MAVFKDTTITNNGKRLLSQALANRKQISFTKLETSAHQYGDDINLEELINLDAVKQSVSLSSLVQDGTLITIKGIFTNRDLREQYQVHTIGCYAKINDENEILYSITRAKDPDTMPAENGINLSTIEVELVTQINNEKGADIKYSPDALVTKSTLATETEAGLVTLNQIKGLIPTIPEASESRAGLISLAKIKELEGEKLEEIIGLKFGGNIQDTGTKTTGKFYYDNVTKFYYECVADTNLTYNESSKFRAISNKPLSDKTEILSNIESHSIDPRLTVGIIHKIGDICVLTVDSASAYNGKNYGDVLFNIPEKFRPKILVPVPAGVHNSTIGGAAQIERNGNVVWRGSRITNSVYINAVYLAK